MSRPFLLFHWSPRSRRKSILRHGLCPKKKSRCGQWRPPYICYSRCPSLAWVLSAEFSGKTGWWDLWQVWSDNVGEWESLPYDNNPSYPYPKEHRVYKRIPKRHIWHVGSRKYQPRKNSSSRRKGS